VVDESKSEANRSSAPTNSPAPKIVDAYDELLSEERESDFSSTGSRSRIHRLRRLILHKYALSIADTVCCRHQRPAERSPKTLMVIDCSVCPCRYGRRDLGSPRASTAGGANAEALVASEMLDALSDSDDGEDLFLDHDGVYANEEEADEAANKGRGWGVFATGGSSDEGDESEIQRSRPLAIQRSARRSRASDSSVDSPGSSLRDASGPSETAMKAVKTTLKESHRASIVALQRELLAEDGGSDGESGNGDNPVEEDSLFGAVDPTTGGSNANDEEAANTSASSRVRSLDPEEVPETFEFNSHWKECFAEFLFGIRRRYHVHNKIVAFRKKLLVRPMTSESNLSDNALNCWHRLYVW